MSTVLFNFQNLSDMEAYLHTLRDEQKATQKTIADAKKRMKFMKKHDAEVMRDNSNGWKAKKAFLRRRLKARRNAVADIHRLQKEEEDREKKIRKIESQIFRMLMEK